MPIARMEAKYNIRLIARARTILRSPFCPYIMLMVSMNTCSAREPDHRDSRNPIERRSPRPPSKVSMIVGSITPTTVSSVRKRRANVTMASVTVCTVSGPSCCPRKPTPAMTARNKGGKDSRVKNAASDASPVTR